MSDKTKGALSLFIAAYSFSLYGVYSKFIASDFGPVFQTVARSFICVLAFGVLAYFFKSLKKIQPEDFKYYLLQGIFSLFVNIFFYIAVIKLPMGTTFFTFYAASLIASFIFGSVFLSEKLNKVKMIALILAVLGIFCMFQDKLIISSSVFIVTAIMAGSFFGLYTSISKKISSKYSVLQINFVMYLSNLILTIPMLFLAGENVSASISQFSWLIIFLYALTSIASGYFVIYGFKHLEAQISSLIMLGEIVFAVANGIIFFREIPTVMVLIGGLFILTAMIIPNLQFEKETK